MAKLPALIQGDLQRMKKYNIFARGHDRSLAVGSYYAFYRQSSSRCTICDPAVCRSSVHARYTGGSQPVL